MPADLCASEPRLQDYGFYRELDNGKLEFMAFCDEKSKHWLAVFDEDFNAILDRTLPKNGDTLQ